MAVEHIAANLSRIRKSRGLSMQKLADRSGVTRMAYSKIEHGQSQPKSGTLVNLAESLNVEIQDLLAPPPQFHSLRFRSHKSLSVRERQKREQIIYDVDRWLKDYNQLEKILNLSSGELPEIDPETPEVTARAFRSALDLDNYEPIADIIGLLEHQGVKLYAKSFDLAKFFGFSVGKEDGGPAIVVNTREDIPIERRIFTVAHELGHLLMHRDSYKQDEVEEIDRQEAEANAFAGYLLLPREGFEREWEECRGLHWADAVLNVKRKYKVSYRTILYRLTADYEQDYQSLSVGFSRYMQMKYGESLKGHHEPNPVAEEEAEPEELSDFDFIEDKLKRLVRDAYEREEISLSRAAEILQVSLAEMRELNSSWKEYG